MVDDDAAVGCLEPIDQRSEARTLDMDLGVPADGFDPLQMARPFRAVQIGDRCREACLLYTSPSPRD